MKSFKPNLESLEIAKDDLKKQKKLENKILSVENEIEKLQPEILEQEQKIVFLTQKLPELKETANVIGDVDSKKLYDKACSKLEELDQDKEKMEKNLKKFKDDLEKTEKELIDLNSEIRTDFYLRCNIALWQARYDLYNKNNIKKSKKEVEELRKFIKNGFPIQYKNDLFVDNRVLKINEL